MHLRLLLNMQKKEERDDFYTKPQSAKDEEKTFEHYFTRSNRHECNQHMRDLSNGAADNELNKLENDFLYFFIDPRTERMHMINPFMQEFPEDQEELLYYYKARKKAFNSGVNKGFITYAPEDSWLHRSLAVGTAYGVWQTAHFLFDHAEENLCLAGPYEWGKGFTGDTAFNPTALIFPFVSGIVAGLVNYVAEVYHYEKRYGHEAPAEIKKQIAKQSAGLFFVTVAGTLGWEAGLLAAKWILVTANILPYGLLANAILAITAGLGMAISTVAAEMAKEKKLYGKIQSSAGYFGKLFLSSFLQGVAWWAFRLIPFALPIMAVGKAIVSGIITLVSVALLNAAVKPKDTARATHALFKGTPTALKIKKSKKSKQPPKAIYQKLQDDDDALDNIGIKLV